MGASKGAKASNQSSEAQSERAKGHSSASSKRSAQGGEKKTSNKSR
jgi:hypothetical protein